MGLALLIALSTATGWAQSSGSAVTYNQRAIARYAKGDLAGAIEDLDIAIKFDPSYADAYNNRCALRCSKRDLDGAIADCSQAIVINPRLALPTIIGAQPDEIEAS